MNGFAMALNPSLGLIGCYNARTGKSMKTCPNEQALMAGNTEPAASISACFGVGIDYRQDTSGTFVVTTLLLGGS